MWAIAKEWGFTDEEFGELSSAQFWTLWHRRSLSFQRECYLNGIIAACLLNVHRTSDQDRVFDAFDFVGKQSRTAAEAAEDAAAERLDAVVLHFRTALALLPPDKVQQAVTEIPHKLRKLGFSERDVAELRDEIVGETKD
jgi:hypothetical protein